MQHTYIEHARHRRRVACSQIFSGGRNLEAASVHGQLQFAMRKSGGLARTEYMHVAGQHQLAGHLAFGVVVAVKQVNRRSEEHTSELQSLMRISYAVFCL